MNTSFVSIFAPMNQPMCDVRCFEAEVYRIKIWFTMIILQSREKLLYDSQLHALLRNLWLYIVAPMLFAYLFSIPQNNRDLNVNIKMEKPEEEEPPVELDDLGNAIVEQLSHHPDGITTKALLRSLEAEWPDLTRETLKENLEYLYENYYVEHRFTERTDILLWALY